jgi:hypothetical protein
VLQAQLQGKDANDDLATKLTKQKLCKLFPNLDRDVLLQVFTAHGNSFERTVEEVMASTGDNQEEHVRTVIAPEALVAHERSLMEQAKQEQCKVDQENKVCNVGTSVSRGICGGQSGLGTHFSKTLASYHPTSAL